MLFVKQKKDTGFFSGYSYLVYTSISLILKRELLRVFGSFWCLWTEDLNVH